MPVQLRPYDPADFEPLYAIDRACYPRGIAYSRRTLRWFLEQAAADCLVARAGPSGDRIVGFIIAEAEGPSGHIITLDVTQSHRRTGVGTALLRASEQRMARRGVRTVFLETATSNEPAVAFWQRHGYRSFGRLPRYYLRRQDAYAMRKMLTPAPQSGNSHQPPQPPGRGA